MRNMERTDEPYTDKLYNEDMERRCASSYLEMVRKEKENFIKTGAISSSVPDFVAQSWIRCRKHKVDWENTKVYKMGAGELKKAIQNNKAFYDIATSVIDTFCRNLKQIDFAMYATDANACILYVNSDLYFNKNINSIDIFVGDVMQERYGGTNSAYLCMRLGRSVALALDEHYAKICCGAYCYAAPVSVGKDVVGSIAITTHNCTNNKYLMNTVCAAAELVANQFLSRRYMNIVESSIDHLSEGVVILNSDLSFLKANNKFLKMIKMSADACFSVDIPSLFHEVDFEKIIAKKTDHLILNETMIKYQGQIYRIRLKVQLLYNDGKLDVIMLFCSNINDIINMSQQITTIGQTLTFDSVITQNIKMKSLINTGKKIAMLDCPVLIEGESGTGKEIFAHALHYESPRRHKPFVAINCAALPLNLVESELFGYEKGSFTGALTTGKPGKFELADQGTIFLDEIGELPLDIQAKLLRVLDNHKVTRMGGTNEKHLDIRVICATNRDLFTEVQSKNFREDLYYRLNVMNIKLPPLDERKDDIPCLVEYFIDNLNRANPSSPKTIDRQSLDLLMRHSWSGNIRELQNVITRAYHLCDGDRISAFSLPEKFREAPAQGSGVSVPSVPGGVTRWDDAEKELILAALRECGGNVDQAAKALHKSRATLYRKIKQYGITR